MTTHRTPIGGLSRREVLLGAAAAAIATTGVLRVLPRGGVGLEGLLDLPRLSVGFLDDVPVASPLGSATGRPVVPAATVGPGPLGATATTSVLGPATEGAALVGPGTSLSLDVLFPVAGLPDPARFHAWSADGSAVSETSSPVTFATPVGEMSVAFQLVLTDPDGSRTATSVMTDRDSQDLPGLRRGTYLLGLQPDVWDTPTTLPAADDPAWRDLASIVVTVDQAG